MIDSPIIELNFFNPSIAELSFNAACPSLDYLFDFG